MQMKVVRRNEAAMKICGWYKKYWLKNFIKILKSKGIHECIKPAFFEE